jgi:cell division protein FtsQ
MTSRLTAPSAPTHQRFAQRTQEAKRRTRRRGVVTLAAAVGVAALAWLVFASPVLAVRTVAVVGVPSAQAGPIRDAAAVLVGTPLARVDTEAVGGKVTMSVPTVQTVDVSRGWPDTLTITVTVRRPEYVVKDGAGVLHLASADGVQYDTVTSMPATLPLVTAGAEAPTAAGLRAAGAALVALTAPQRSAVKDVRVSGNMVEFGVGAVTVSWGDGSQADRKARILTVLLATKPKPRLIDVRAPATPITR